MSWQWGKLAVDVIIRLIPVIQDMVKAYRDIKKEESKHRDIKKEESKHRGEIRASRNCSENHSDILKEMEILKDKIKKLEKDKEFYNELKEDLEELRKLGKIDHGKIDSLIRELNKDAKESQWEMEAQENEAEACRILAKVRHTNGRKVVNLTLNLSETDEVENENTVLDLWSMLTQHIHDEYPQALLPQAPWMINLPMCLKCQICYSSQERQPVLLPQCGHDICQYCVGELIDTEAKLQCPFCQSSNSLEDLKPNYSLMNMIAEIEDKSDSFMATSFHRKLTF